MDPGIFQKLFSTKVNVPQIPKVFVVFKSVFVIWDVLLGVRKGSCILRPSSFMIWAVRGFTWPAVAQGRDRNTPLHGVRLQMKLTGLLSQLNTQKPIALPSVAVITVTVRTNRLVKVPMAESVSFQVVLLENKTKLFWMHDLFGSASEFWHQFPCKKRQFVICLLLTVGFILCYQALKIPQWIILMTKRKQNLTMIMPNRRQNTTFKWEDTAIFVNISVSVARKFSSESPILPSGREKFLFFLGMSM